MNGVHDMGGMHGMGPIVLEEDDSTIHVVPNLLLPDAVTRVPKRDVLQRIPSKVSSMPEGLISALTREEILDLLAYLEAGGYKLPPAIQKHRHESSPH